MLNLVNLVGNGVSICGKAHTSAQVSGSASIHVCSGNRSGSCAMVMWLSDW